MVWRKNTTEEIEELRHFVDGMKRGQTLPTNDSILETLRQIHDRREAPVAGHDHKQLLQERLRRQMRANRGLEDDATPILVYEPRPAPRRFLQWAVAASVALHVILGVVAVQQIRFEQLMIGYGEAEAAAPVERATVLFVPPPVRIDPKIDPSAHVTTEDPSAPHAGRGHEAATAGVGGPRNVVPTASSLPVGPPVAPGGAPIVSGFQDGSIESQADAGIGEEVGPSLVGPEAPPPLVSEVRGSSFDSIEETFDVKPRILTKPTPIYSDQALRYQIKGTVRVSAVLGADGTIREVSVIKSLGYGLDEAAMDAVRRMKFAPAMRAGKPVSVRTKIEIAFGLH
jgi:protein TonB